MRLDAWPNAATSLATEPPAKRWFLQHVGLGSKPSTSIPSLIMFMDMAEPMIPKPKTPTLRVGLVALLLSLLFFWVKSDVFWAFFRESL